MKKLSYIFQLCVMFVVVVVVVGFFWSVFKLLDEVKKSH